MKRVTLLAALTVLITAPADAATLVNSGGRLTYTATSGAAVNIDFSYGNTDYVGVVPQSAYNHDPIQVTGCTTNTHESFVSYTCPGVKEVVATGGPGDDVFGSQNLAVPLTADGGPGDDQLSGGDAADTLSGGTGDDVLYGETGDTLSGGTGIDHALYTLPGDGWFKDGVSMTPVGPVSITLDGVADDGLTGDRVNFHADIENLESDNRSVWSKPLPTYGPVTLVGSESANHLIGSSGPDTITGAGGMDLLESAGGDDTLLARDGLPDRVRCGSGLDVAFADRYDVVSDTCEQIHVEGPALDDAPPRLAWGSGLAVDASDDRGIASVQWFDDDRLLCTDTAAPFDCAFAPRVEDVGANTIVVVATDTAGQTVSLIATRTVERFRPSAVTLKLKGRVASGRVTLPAGVPCTGKVAVGGRTAALRRDCTYRVTVKRASAYVARYLGTDAIAAKSSKRVRARTQGVNRS